MGNNQQMNMFDMLNLIENSHKSGEEVAKILLQQNPQANQFVTQVNNMRGKKSMKDFTLQIARQKGIDTKKLEEFARKMGGK